MRPHADRAPAFAVERNDCFGCYLPGVSYICQSGIHRGGRFLPERPMAQPKPAEIITSCSSFPFSPKVVVSNPER
jgi:hypothetical protein